MTQLHNPQLPVIDVPQPRKTPQLVARAVGAVVLASIQIALYVAAGIVACGVLWIVLRATIWACNVANTALGFGR